MRSKRKLIGSGRSSKRQSSVVSRVTKNSKRPSSVSKNPKSTSPASKASKSSKAKASKSSKSSKAKAGKVPIGTVFITNSNTGKVSKFKKEQYKYKSGDYVYKVDRYIPEHNIYIMKSITEHHNTSLGTPFPAITVEEMFNNSN